MCRCVFKVEHFQNDRPSHDNNESSRDIIYPIVMKIHKNAEFEVGRLHELQFFLVIAEVV
jgi:hypothetical protein